MRATITRPPLPKPADKIRRDADHIRQIAADASGRLLYVASVANGLARLKEADGTLIDQPIAYISAAALQVGDSVIRVAIAGRGHKNAAGTFVAVGPIKRKSNDATMTERLISATNASVATNANTGVFVLGGSASIPLGPGSWSITGDVDIALIHSASGKADIQVSIDGVITQRQTANLSPTVYSRWRVSARQTGIAGNRNVLVEVYYKPFNAGTVSAANPVADGRGVRE